MTDRDALIARLRAWARDERLGSGALLLEAADALSALPPPADPPRAAFDAMEMAVYGKPGNTMTPEQIVRWRDFLYQWCLPADPPALVALREAEDATWAGAVSYVRDMAATVRAMAQKFVADPGMAELAKVRAEALDNCADGMERAAKKARAAVPPVTDTPQGSCAGYCLGVRPYTSDMHCSACMGALAALPPVGPDAPNPGELPELRKLSAIQRAEGEGGTR